MALYPVVLMVALALSGRMQPMVQATCGHASAVQCQQLNTAIGSSQALSRQLDELAENGLLTAITIVDRAQAPRIGNSQFGATYFRGTIYLTKQFLADAWQSQHVRPQSADDLHPDALVFALGHLAHNARNAKAVDESRAAIERAAELANTAPGDATTLIRNLKTMHMEYEAGAYLQGWNDVVDAATSANGGVRLSTPKAGMLLVNLRYHAPILRAAQRQPGPLVAAADGTIPAGPQNIEALAEALGALPLLDIEPE